MASPVVQLRIPEEMLAAIDGARGGESRTTWLLRLAELELTGEAPAVRVAASVPAAAVVAVAAGSPSPGVVCFQPGCWQRNTSRYGLHGLPLCPGCHAALEGRVYTAPVSADAVKLLKRGAA